MTTPNNPTMAAMAGTLGYAETSAPPVRALFSVSQIVLASVFGTALAGATMMALNYKRLGKPQLAKWPIVIGVLVVVGLTVALPLGSGIFRFPAIAIVTGRLAQFLQGKAIDAHKAAGGAMTSGWKVVLFSLAGLFVALVFATVDVLARG